MDVKGLFQKKVGYRIEAHCAGLDRVNGFFILRLTKASSCPNTKKSGAIERKRASFMSAPAESCTVKHWTASDDRRALARFYERPAKVLSGPDRVDQGLFRVPPYPL